MKNKIKFLIDRAKSPTPKFWQKTRNYMLAVGGISTLVIIGGSFLPIIIVKIAGYGLTAGTIGTALSQLAKVKEEDDEKKDGVRGFTVIIDGEDRGIDVGDIEKAISMIKGVVDVEPIADEK